MLKIENSFKGNNSNVCKESCLPLNALKLFDIAWNTFIEDCLRFTT